MYFRFIDCFCSIYNLLYYRQVIITSYNYYIIIHSVHQINMHAL